MEEFRTSIFEKTKDKSRKRLVYNLGIFGAIGGIWVLYFIGFPMERKANLVIAEQHLEISDVKIPYSELTNLVIYVEEYLGMPKEIYGIHHGGNNKIEFDRNGKTVSVNYVIKNKQDFQRVSLLVDGIEKNPILKKNLRKL